VRRWPEAALRWRSRGGGDGVLAATGCGAEVLWQQRGPNLGLSGPDLDPWATAVASFWCDGPLLVGGARATGYGAAGACCSSNCADLTSGRGDLALLARCSSTLLVGGARARRAWRVCSPFFFPRVKGGRSLYSGICGVPAFYGVTISVPSWR
jgi:hypothetical protein